MHPATIIIRGDAQRELAIRAIRQAPVGHAVTIREATRSLEQNARMWAMLGDVSRQVIWHGRRLSPEDWKNMFTAELKGYEIAPNLSGTGFVALGMSTSAMSKRELSDLMELMAAFGAERGVLWSEPGRDAA